MKWRWVAVGFVVVVGCALVVLNSSDRPPYGFIEKLHGDLIVDPFTESSEYSEAYVYYGFKESAKTVAEAASQQFMTLGPARLGRLTITTFSSGVGDQFSLIESPNVPKVYTCVVVLDPKPGWLERQWQAVRGWFHRDQVAR